MPMLSTEIELISASLLASEELQEVSGRSGAGFVIINAESGRSVHVDIGDGYPSRDAVKVVIKAADVGRDEAAVWNTRISEIMRNWDDAEEFPLYQIVTAQLLPLIAPSESHPRSDFTRPQAVSSKPPPAPHHVLLTSHHLLSTTKRRDFLRLSSQLSLTGFAKVGHPGIYYAMGERMDLEEWLREVKSWNWLALRVRVGIEPVTGEDQLSGRGSGAGARGGRGRGDWTELEKISDALVWMKKRGRQEMLLDIGIGGSSES